ncbi:helix-turn-helix domain-containing protein [Glycomyces salinus]|uniref:helix-turn-helix domain-containing protein n=1 Tax=Glycomyces salinus TaxID=980294 RepID=UPI0018EB8F87|nr:helix-turn-helix transcriptional regulator [Glycomyces salinus]
MIRPTLTPAERARGRALGRTLREARGDRALGEVAYAAGVSPETLRKIETGRIAAPAFFTVASLCRVLGLSIAELAADASPRP